MSSDNSYRPSDPDPGSGVPPAQPRWMVPVIVGAGLIAIFAVWWVTGRENDQTVSPPSTPSVAAQAPAATPSPRPTRLDEATPASPPANTPAQAIVIDSPLATATIVLPTVTPTSPPVDIEPRSVEILGDATLRLTFANPGFQSDGRPVSVEIDSHAYRFDSSTVTADDRWCVQLGLFNLQFDMALEINPENGDLDVSGAIRLHDDFCDEPGVERDRVAVELTVPADASAEIGYSLHGERKLLGATDLLDATTGVAIEMTFSNTSP